MNKRIDRLFAPLFALGLALALAGAAAAQTKTRVIDYARDAAGNPLSGKVTFILTQKSATSADGLVVASPTVSAVLDSAGKFDVQLYPSASLSPVSYYQVYVTSGAGSQTLVGVYNIPTSATPVTLAPYKVTDANLAAQYTFASLPAVQALASSVATLGASGVANHSLLRAEGGAIQASGVSDNGTTVTIGRNTAVSGTMTATAFVGSGAGLTGVGTGTGGVQNSGSTTVGADDETPPDGVGVVDLQTRKLTRLRVENNGDISFGSDAAVKFGSLAAKPRELFSRTGIFGNVLSGHSATLNVFTDPNNEGGDWVAWFSHEGSATNNEALMRLQHFSQGFSPLPIFTGIAARGTRASPSAVQSGDHLMVIDGRGYDGSSTNWSEYAVGFSDTAAQMAMQAAGNWSGTDHRTRIIFKNVPAGSTTPVAALTLEGTETRVEGQFTLNHLTTHINTKVANSDIAGTLNTSGGTSASKMFAAAYGNAPACTVSPLQDMGAVRWWVGRSTTAINVFVSSAGTYQFDYQCKGNPN